MGNGNHEENGENGEKKKPEMRPAKYNIYINEQKKVVSKVPLSHLRRTGKSPSRSILMKFIRTHSLRPHIAKKMIVLVDKELVEKHQLKSKLAEEMITEYLQHSMVDALCGPIKGKVPVVNKSPVVMKHAGANGNTLVPIATALEDGTLKVVQVSEETSEKKMYPMFQKAKLASPSSKPAETSLPSNGMEGVVEASPSNTKGPIPFMKSPAVDGQKRKRGRPRRSDQPQPDGSALTPSRRQKRVASFVADDISKYMASKESMKTPPHMKTPPPG